MMTWMLAFIGTSIIGGETLDIAKILIELGAFGVIVWIVIHLFRNVLPKTAENFAAALEAERIAAKEEAEATREFFINELTIHRQSHAQAWNEFKEELHRQRTSHSDQITKLATAISEMTAGMAKMTSALEAQSRGEHG